MKNFTKKPALINEHPSLNSDIEKRLTASKKNLLTQIIFPVFLVTSFFLMISHWGADMRSLIGMSVLVLIVIFNTFLSKKNRVIKTIWGEFETRSDEVDTVRWFVNFMLDTFLVWSLDVHSTAIVMVWLLLTFGAMADIKKKNNKIFIITVSFTTFCILIIFFYSLDVKTLIYLVSCYLALILILWKLEDYLVKEIASLLVERSHREQVEIEALKIQKEAAIGNSTRAISHEINNLISAGQLSTEMLRYSKHEQDKELERLDKVFSYMTKISSLVLDDLGKGSVSKRCISLADLENDIQLLLCIGLDKTSISLIVNFPNNADQCFFEERAGSTYLIIHNLVKNAYEAIIEQDPPCTDGIIKIVAKKKNKKISISVSDNGPGITKDQYMMIESDDITTSRNRGHGLGLKFINNECRLNDFILSHKKTNTAECCFTLII